MAHAYSSLGYPTKAAPLFAKFQPPANFDKKIEKKAKETDKEMEARQQFEEDVGRYWGVQIEHIRALRACKDKDSLKQAEDLAKKIIGTETAKYKLQAMMERNFLIEDQGRFLEAYTEWSKKFMTMPSISGPNLAKPEVQKIYFTAYFYQVRTLYKTAIFDKTIKDRPKLIEGCAKQIIKLEYTKGKQGWQIAEPLFKEFFNDPDADKLKKEYDKLKALQEKEKGTSLWNPRQNESGERVAHGGQELTTSAPRDALVSALTMCREGEAPTEPAPRVSDMFPAGSGSAGASPSRPLAIRKTEIPHLEG